MFRVTFDNTNTVNKRDTVFMKMAGRHFMFICCLFVFVLLHAFDNFASTYSPDEFARLASAKLTENTDHFLVWDYGGALVFDGLYEINQTFGISYELLLNKFLDRYETNPTSYGYKVLHNITVPFYRAIGDEIGLFPINYLNRALLKHNMTGPDFYVARNVVDDYILKWPKRLNDGTITRSEGWPGEPKLGPTFVWADDQYMGLTLAARLGRVLKNQQLINFVARQQLSFIHHLQDPQDGLFYHGYNDADQHHSCCKWGRANGWCITATVEVLLALEDFKDSQHVLRADILKSFQKHAEGMLKYQSADGRWRQVVNESSTFLETSCTAMTLSALSRAVSKGWLDKGKFGPRLDLAWKGLQSVLKADGTVDGVCSGTGIQTSVKDYEKRPTSYLNSRAGGVGSVLHAADHYFLLKTNQPTN